jgi:heme-degrading monooxygenase HmoA
VATTAVVKLRVGSYQDWKKVFDEVADLRRKHGITRHLVYRGVEDQNEVFVSTEWPSLEMARGFYSDPELRAAMQRAGIQGGPEFVWYGEETESTEY